MTIYGRRGNLIRVLYLAGAVLWYILTIGGRWGRAKVLILCYHGITPNRRERFHRQMLWIKNRSFGIESLVRKKSANAMELSKVCVTFDDAYENLIENALPILKKFNISAVIFAVPGNLGETPQWKIATGYPEYNEKTMTAQQLKSIQSELIKIGSHTQTHPDLTQLSSEQIRKELTESKIILEKLLGISVEDVALPYGLFNGEVLQLARNVGYKRIYTLEPIVNRKNGDIDSLGRFSMSPEVWQIEFCLTCAGAYSWLYLFRKIIKYLSK